MKPKQEQMVNYKNLQHLPQVHLENHRNLGFQWQVQQVSHTNLHCLRQVLQVNHMNLLQNLQVQRQVSHRCLQKVMKKVSCSCYLKVLNHRWLKKV